MHFELQTPWWHLHEAAQPARDFKPALPVILAPVILIAGMLAGFFTPTEIAAVTVA